VQSLTKENGNNSSIYRATVVSPAHLTGQQVKLSASISDEFTGVLTIAMVAAEQ
jgi:hypothetical protein